MCMNDYIRSPSEREFSGEIERSADGKEIRHTIPLTSYEKNMIKRIQAALNQPLQRTPWVSQLSRI